MTESFFSYLGKYVEATFYIDLNQSALPLCQLHTYAAKGKGLCPQNRSNTFERLIDLLSDIIIKITFPDDPSNTLDDKSSIKAFLLSLYNLPKQEDLWRITGHVIGHLLKT